MSDPTNPATSGEAASDKRETARQPLVRENEGAKRAVTTPAPTKAASRPAKASTTPAAAKTSASGSGASAATVATRANDKDAGKDSVAAGSRVKPSRTRKARLRVSRIDPWSAMKTSFLFAIAGGIIFWMFTYFVWAAIGSSGLFDSINTMVSSIVNAPNETEKFQIQKYVSTNKVLGFAAILAFVDVILLTILGTLGSFLYNLSATMLGGLEVTLAED